MSTPVSPSLALPLRFRTTRLLAIAALVGVAAAFGRRARDPIIIVPASVRDSLNKVWTNANRHWDQLAEQNMLTQALGTGRTPTQKEYLGCLVGTATGDSFEVLGWVPARDMIRFQFAVTGSCDSVEGAIGTFHTHPYRAGPNGEALKEPGLSKQDLMTFMRGTDRALIVIWDVDSLDIALRDNGGRVIHPAVLVAH